MGQTGVSNSLLANKADVNARDNEGETPLHSAHKDDVAELLREHGGHKRKGLSLEEREEIRRIMKGAEKPWPF